ncbi:F-box/kelch-repeat protein At1g23390 [Salvia hispanica]|uniref:F-box/kelch-repeat protein At1g23390 n=1 Tax=Salvia hispanica TaxID=49212 RepID=UPI0020096C9A|nr:F-box/kelch-repeat protein At1g23390 [Salvia hispanica]
MTDRKKKMATRVEREEEAEIHGDVLEAIFSHVPSVDLVSASHVSESWHGAVATSLRHPKPWLILHTQSTRPPHALAALAYDPRSDVWMRIRRPPIEHVAALRSSSTANMLYMLSPSAFAFSTDRLHSDWRSVTPPRVWRTDPIVARVAGAVVVAGGACYFEDDPLAVELYDLRERAWRTCKSMPPSLKDSASSSWLSAAATQEKLFLVEKQTGLTHWFDPEANSWSGPIALNPSQPVQSCHVSYSSFTGLILVGICPIGNGETIKMWRIGENDFSIEEIGEMPEDLVAGLKSDSEDFSIDVRLAGNFVYVYNSAAAEEVVACELAGECRWWKVRNVVERDGMILNTLVFTCAEVGIGELERVMTTKGWRFEVV